MRRLKKCSRALNRQVREAIEISQDTSSELLNSEQEYNRCILPKMTVIGPPTLAVQRQQEPEPPSMTPEQEDDALRKAKSKHNPTSFSHRLVYIQE